MEFDITKKVERKNGQTKKKRKGGKGNTDAKSISSHKSNFLKYLLEMQGEMQKVGFRCSLGTTES